MATAQHPRIASQWNRPTLFIFWNDFLSSLTEESNKLPKLEEQILGSLHELNKLIEKLERIYKR